MHTPRSVMVTFSKISTVFWENCNETEEERFSEAYWEPTRTSTIKFIQENS